MSFIPESIQSRGLARLRRPCSPNIRDPHAPGHQRSRDCRKGLPRGRIDGEADLRSILHDDGGWNGARRARPHHIAGFRPRDPGRAEPGVKTDRRSELFASRLDHQEDGPDPPSAKQVLPASSRQGPSRALIARRGERPAFSSGVALLSGRRLGRISLGNYPIFHVIMYSLNKYAHSESDHLSNQRNENGLTRWELQEAPMPLRTFSCAQNRTPPRTAG